MTGVLLRDSHMKTDTQGEGRDNGGRGWSDALEKEMATHSSILAWGIPGMGEPGGLPSMGSHRVGHG